ncbi:hypothetical protein LXL04_011549 [Taraxacum kok-saghyz]
MPAHKSKSEKNDPEKHSLRDPYDVLSVSRNSTDQEIKSAYRKLALKYHPDKNANDPKATDMFNEITFSYNILSDPDKRHQYDTAGFEAVDSKSQDLELDLSSLGAVNTMFAALFSKLGVPIKTTVSATLLEEALNGTVTTQPIELGQPIVRKILPDEKLPDGGVLLNPESSGVFFGGVLHIIVPESRSDGPPGDGLDFVRSDLWNRSSLQLIWGLVKESPSELDEAFSKVEVEKQCAHFYSVTITEKQAQAGLVCRVQSSDKSKFKLLYFDQEENGGLNLALQEDSAKTGKVTSAGMYFLGFPVYRLDPPSNSMGSVKDPDAVFFKKLDGFQPCEIHEIKAGMHTFAVYGDNFFKSVSYTIEVLCTEAFVEEKESLRAVEAQILSKRLELSKFESEYKQVLAQFTEMTGRYAQEMQAIDELLTQRNEIHASYTTVSPIKRTSSSSSSGSSSRRRRSKSKGGELKEDGHQKASSRERTKKKKWFNIHVKVDKKKPCGS